MLKEVVLSVADGLDLPSLVKSVVTKGVIPTEYRGALSKILTVLRAPGLGVLAWKELVHQLLDRNLTDKAELGIRSATLMTTGTDIDEAISIAEMRPHVVEMLEQLLAREAPHELLAAVKCPYCERHFTQHS